MQVWSFVVAWLLASGLWLFADGLRWFGGGLWSFAGGVWSFVLVCGRCCFSNYKTYLTLEL